MRKIAIMILFIISFTPFAWADDTVEASPTGNIVFEKAPELIMQDETLTISKSASQHLGEESFSIDVDFHLKNISDHDVTRKIAFVLPPVQCRMDVNSTWGGLDSNDTTGMRNNGLKDFTTTVNGKSQAVTTRTEAMLDQHNITSLLTKLNIPLNPCKVQTTINGEPDPKYSLNLKKYHLLTQSNDAAWSENIYFEWTQTFPAGNIINIHHHYTPIAGGSVLSPRTLKEINDEFTKNNPPLNPVWNRSPISLSDTNPTIVTIKNDFGSSNNQKRFCLMPSWIQYNLITGANWNHGIGIFKLIIQDDANAPFAVNEFYSNNDKVQINKSENKMTFTITDFVPTQNLFVQFLILPQSPEDLQLCGI
jgi:hypothetical protein